MTSQDNAQRLHVIVHGRVQGVGFRWFVQRRAQDLKLTGTVRNCPDGSVAVIAEGRRPALDVLLASLQQGPPSARVTTVEYQWQTPSGQYQSFQTIG